MSGIWNIIRHALHEADAKTSLLSYVAKAYGEHEADQLNDLIGDRWNNKELPSIAQHLIQRYTDPKVTDLISRGMQTFGHEQPQAKRGRGRPPGSSASVRVRPASKAPSEPERRFVDPDQAKVTAAKAAEVGASRPDRAGAQSPVMPKFGQTVTPGERPPGHQFGGVRGTSPGHTRPPQSQPSQEKIPSKMGRELDPLRAKEKELSRQVAGLSADPTQKMAADRAKGELSKVQQQIARLTGAGSSGVEDAQKRVDYINQTYGKPGKGDEPSYWPGDKVAKQLGVPTTRERTRKVTDPKTGEEKQVVQIWNADKVFQHLNKGGSSEKGTLAISPELKPGKFDMPGGPGLPVEPTGKRQKGDVGQRTSGVQKPMMKAPKGLDASSLQNLSSLRHQFSKAKKENDTEQMASLKGEIDQIMASGHEIIDVVRPGTKIGQRWKPSGVSQKVKTSRPDQATGNFIRGSRFTNPAEEGDELVWNGKDWVSDASVGAKEGTVREGRVWDGSGWILPSVWITRPR